MPRWVEYMGGALSFVNQTPLTEVVSNIEPLDTELFVLPKAYILHPQP